MPNQGLPWEEVVCVHPKLEPLAALPAQPAPHGDGGALPNLGRVRVMERLVMIMLLMWQKSHQSIGNLHGGELFQVSHDQPQEQQEDDEDRVVDKNVAVEEEDGEDRGEGFEAVIVEDIDHTRATAEEGGESKDGHEPQGQFNPLDEGLVVEEVLGPCHEVGLSAHLADQHHRAEHAHEVKLPSGKPDLHDEQKLAGGLKAGLHVGEVIGELLHLRGVHKDSDDLDTEQEEAAADGGVEENSWVPCDEIETDGREAETKSKQNADRVLPLGQLLHAKEDQWKADKHPADPSSLEVLLGF